jgi:hypothetical protein
MGAFCGLRVFEVKYGVFYHHEGHEAKSLGHVSL